MGVVLGGGEGGYVIKTMRTIEFILKGKGSDLQLRLPKAINIPEGHHASLGLKNFSTYNNIPNVHKNVNNAIRVLTPGDATWKTFQLETGAWELNSIAESLYSWIEHEWPQLRNVRKDFKLSGENATSRCIFTFKNEYGIDFNIKNSMYTLLGFQQTDRFVGRGLFKAPGIANIARVTQILFNCNIVETSWLNKVHIPLLYNCVVDVPAGYRMYRDVQTISYKKLNTPTIQVIHLWIEDEERRAVDLRDDLLVVTLSLNIVPPVNNEGGEGSGAIGVL